MEWRQKKEKVKRLREKYYKNMIKMILMRAQQAESKNKKDTTEEVHNKSDVRINENSFMIFYITTIHYPLFKI